MAENKLSKDSNSKVNSTLQEITDKNEASEEEKINTSDSVSVCIDNNFVEESKTGADLKQYNETVLDIPLPKSVKFKKFKKSRHKIQMFGQLNLNKPREIWVQFFGIKTQPSLGTPLEYNPESRNNFVMLVMTIVTVMLMVTAVISIGIAVSPLREFFIRHGLIITIGSCILSISLSYVFACSQCSRNFPCNMICLALAVIAMSAICTFVTIIFNTKLLLLAVLATAAAVFLCTLLACSKFDFTSWLLYIVIIMGALAAATLMMVTWRMLFGIYFKPVHIALVCAGIVMNCIMLVMELQMILGGRQVELSENDYALAAYMLYMSIIELFLKIAQLLHLLDE